MVIDPTTTVAPQHYQHQHYYHQHQHHYPMDRISYSSVVTKAHKPTILKRRMRYSKPYMPHVSYPFKPITSRTNTPLYPCSSAGKRIKIVLHEEAALPSSFFPPPSPTSVKHTIQRPVSISPTPKKVHFYSRVQVMKIPSRKDYGEDLRKQIWTSTKELAQNAKRNSMEYASEGWKLSGVIEEENFYFNHMTGEYVHPIHVHREHQKRVMQARQKAEAAKAA